MRRNQVLSIIATGLLLAGCAGRAEGVLVPIQATVPGATTVDLLVATTREKSTVRGELFSGERGETLSMTDIKVSIPPAANRQVGQVQWPEQMPPDPSREFATLEARPIAGRDGARAWIGEHIPRGRQVLVFVHGFNNRYEDAVYRFAQIVNDSGADVAPILFTWPSRASIFDYNYDKESTNYSRDALEEMLQAIAENPRVGDVTIMAHSMGTWLAVEALRQMAIRDGRVEPKIRNVVLASPDLDVDVFSRQFQSLGRDKPQFTIFVSRDDRALNLSRRISGSVDRLGQVDPTVEPYRTEFEKAGINVIDLTAVASGDSLNHGKFAESPLVVQAIGNRILAGQPITDSDVGLGERIGAVAVGAAQTVGSAASVAVSTPIAIVDPRTRRNYGDQVERLGRSVGNTVTSVGNTVEGVGETVLDGGRR